jgi:DNA ligase-1
MKPMKPSTIEDTSLLRFPLLGSPKLDGFRCRVYNKVAMTSNWKPVVNEFVQRTLGGLDLLNRYADGELIVGKPRGEGVLQRTSSGVTSRDGEPDFTFYVFDMLQATDVAWNTPFRSRLDDAKAFVKMAGHKRMQIVAHKLIRNMDEFDEYCAQQLLAGYEGAMFRDPNGPHKFGRSTPREGYLWRYKPFTDSEMKVEGWYEQEHNGNEATTDALGRSARTSHKAGKSLKGMLGGFTGTDIHSGQPVRVGTGYTDQQRKDWWKLPFAHFDGKILKYKKQLAGEKDKPRHPVFLDWRDINDL